jgi:translation initiation factor 2B subunit (eIF-2B alpha/beta/delta family)
MKMTFKQLQEIKTTSSFDFCLLALRYLQNFINNTPIKNRDTFLLSLNDQSRALVKMQPNMANLKKKISTVIYVVKKAMKTRKTNAEIIEYTLEKISDIIAQSEQTREKIGSAGSKLISSNARVVTIGNSTLVADIIITAFNQKRKFEVYCLESAPTREGITLAETLARKGISTFLYNDAGIGVILPQATLVLSGAVRIYEEGFVNKIGTLPLALTARSLKLPFYLAADTDKILIEREYAIRFYRQDPDEIHIPRSKNLKIHNVYYESVPLSLLTKLITEDGIFDLVEFKNWYLKD